MNIATTPPPKALLVPYGGPSTGAYRQSLTSQFRRLCEKNQLTVASALSQFILTSQDALHEGPYRLGDGSHLLNRGGRGSQKLIAHMEALSTLSGLQNLTLHELVEIDGVGDLCLSPFRKWCGSCYDDDLDTELGPYDRLLWAIDQVQVCPIHKMLLRKTCSACGYGPIPLLTGRDISGRCPKCLEWLGGSATPLESSSDSHSNYLLWVSRSFAHLLELPLEEDIDVASGIRSILTKLAEYHFAGIVAHLAAEIRRNRSVVTTWLKGNASPSWQALCEISFAFQIPLRDLLRGDTDCVTFSSIRTLPLAILKRLTHPRKLPQKRDVPEIRKFLDRVARGELKNVLTIREIEVRLRINRKWLAKHLPEETCGLSATLEERRKQHLDQKRSTRRHALQEGVRAAVARLRSQGKSVSRRSVDRELALHGILIGRRESPEVLGFVREANLEYDASKLSGNK